jgi:toxin ParE1/3/4
MAVTRRPVAWSPDARLDLSEIWDFYAAAGGSRVADQIVRRIVEASRPLNRHPLAGRSRDEIRPGLRSRATGSHVIFYRVRDDVAEIVRVLDGRRDLQRIFDDDVG